MGGWVCECVFVCLFAIMEQGEYSFVGEMLGTTKMNEAEQWGRVTLPCQCMANLRWVCVGVYVQRWVGGRETRMGSIVLEMFYIRVMTTLPGST